MNIELNKYYRNRKGEVVKIIENTNSYDYPFMGSDRESYTKDGRHLQCVTDSRDLIEEVIPTPVVRVLEVQTNTGGFVGAMEESKGKVYTEFDKILGSYESGRVQIKGYSYFPDQIEEGIICHITGEFIAMKNELSVEKKQEVTKVEYGVVYVANVHGDEFFKGERIVLQEDDGTDLPWFKSEDGRVKRECFYIKDLGIYAPPKLKLEVGKKYKIKDGRVVTVKRAITDENYKFIIDDNGIERRYTEDGYYHWKKGESDLNIIEEVVEPKLKLEVGKKYRTRGGEVTSQLQSRDSSIYPFTVEGNTYTKGGAYHSNGKESQYDLIEEVVETKLETKQETKEMKYYLVTEKEIFKVGDIVVLYDDDGSSCPEYKNVNTGEKNYHHTKYLEEINIKITTLVKGPASRMIKQLEDEGWVLEVDEEDNEIGWINTGDTEFRGGMLQYCGKPKPSDGWGWGWNDEWLETKYEFESLVKPKPSLNHRQFLIDFMKKKQELCHPSYLYTGDVNEMKNDWSDEDCERVANDIISRREFGFGSDTCPFCVYNNNVNTREEECEECSYGKRHGICGNSDSDYKSEAIPNRKDGHRAELRLFITNYPRVNKK